MNAVVKLQANLVWQAKQSETSSRWIGVCAPINLVMEADSLDELHSLIPETLQLLFADLLEDDELATFLQSKGWTAQNLPEAMSASDVHFDVPWELVAEGRSRDSQRSAH